MENGKEDFINSVNLNINTDFPYLVLDVINDKSYPRNPIPEIRAFRSCTGMKICNSSMY